MRFQSLCLVALMTAAGATAASAQEFGDSKSFSVNANFNIQMPLASGAQTADLASAIAQLTQQLGDLANRECDVLSSAFKADCRVSQLNFGTNVNDRRNRRMNGEGEADKMINANVQAVFALTPNATPPKPAPTSTP